MWGCTNGKESWCHADESSERRLQPPNPEDRTMPNFKPGTSTWNTDDPSQAPPWVRAQVCMGLCWIVPR